MATAEIFFTPTTCLFISRAFATTLSGVLAMKFLVILRARKALGLLKSFQSNFLAALTKIKL